MLSAQPPTIPAQEFAILDRSGRFTMVSPGIGALLGIAADELAGSTFNELKVFNRSASTNARIGAHFRDALNGQTGAAQLEQLGEPLARITLEYTLAPLTSGGGQITHVLFTLRDVTAQASGNEAVREASTAQALADRYRTLIHSLPGSTVLVFDHDLRYVIVEGAEVFARHGYVAEEMIGRTLSEVIQPEYYAVLLDFYQAALAGQEIRTEFRNGGRIYETHFFPVYNRDKTIAYGTALTEDVTDERAPQEALRLSERRFRALAASIPDSMVLVFDQDLRYVIVEGRRLLARVCYDADVMVGKTLAEVVTDEARYAYNEMLYRSALEGRELKVEVERDGVILLARFFPVRDEDGTVVYGVLIAEDITADKQKAAALHESQMRFERVFEESPLGIALTSADYQILSVNPAMADMLGYSVAELLTLRVLDFTHPDDLQVDRDLRVRLFAGEIDHYHYERRFIHRDGHVVWGSVTVGLVRDDDGQPLYTVSQLEDISERKRIEAELRASQARFQSAFANSPLGMMLATLDYRTLSVNPALARILGYSVAELLEVRPKDITHPDDLTLDRDLRPRLFAGEIDHYHYERRFIHRDGHVVWASATVGLVRDDDGQPLYIIVQVEDISERKRSEAALREAQALFESAFANSPLGMVLVTPDGRFFESNASFQRMLGYSAAEIHQLDVDRITVPEDLEADRVCMRRLLAGEADHYRLEKRYIRKDGAIIWIVLTAALIRDEQGAPLYFVSQIEDITERKRAEAELRVSQARFQRAFENSPIGMALIAPDLHVMSVNRAFEEMVGYSSGELTGMSAHDITYPDDIPPDDAEKRRLFAGEIHHYQIEKRYIHKDGRIIWTTLTESVIRDEQGAPLYLVAQIEDITERKRMITELRESRERYESLVSSLPGMVFQLRQTPDGAQHFDYINPRIYELVGLTAEEIMADARVLIALVDESDQASLFATQDHSRHRLEPFVWEGLFHLPSGETAYFHIESQPVREPDGATVWTGIGVDITAQRYLQTALLEQEKLRVSLAKEREVSDLKSNMMVHISHEFRTPLAIIQSSSELLDRYGERMTADKRREHTTRVYDQVHYLAAILDELSLLARRDGMSGANPMRVSLPELCGRVIERVQGLTHDSHVIDLRVAQRLPKLVSLDPRLVETMLMKLMQNAAKFSEPGTRIRIELDVTGHEVLINVSDEGIGIPEDEINGMFEPFFKGSNNDLPTGLGLGLSIVRDAVLLHGGTIQVKSVVGEGTVFMIRLPQQMA